ncbi:MAG: FeoA domain-containing protein [Pirellulaceae bacterium]|nr:FeoA domain-containing protein [Pirellulaceae bacterium]
MKTSPMPPLFLSDLRRRTAANVVAVHGADGVSLRLLEMGLVPGTQVTRVGSGPMGDPLEFELLGFSLSLRKAEARRVEVQVQEVREKDAIQS